MINIVAIDPGSNTGVSVYSLDPNTLTILNVETFLFTLDNYIVVDDKEDRMLEKLLMLNSICEWLSTTYQPVALMAEAAFLNVRFPKAVMHLSQYIATIELSFKRLNPRLKIFRYPPKYIKKVVGATGSADKDLMTKTVNSISEITNFVNPLVVSEHEVDALAIGYVGIGELKTYPHLLYS